MPSPSAFFRWSELDSTTFPEFRERIAAAETEGEVHAPRSYPGYPSWPLKRSRPRIVASIDVALRSRRSIRTLSAKMPGPARLGRILEYGHGRVSGKGPVPSAGDLQALELYLVTFESAWIPPGIFHYGRGEHVLTQIEDSVARADWEKLVPSMAHVSGGALLWVIVGDGARVEPKYGERGYRFLLLEAGHLLQNLCLLSSSLGLSTVPLGGFFERQIAAALSLPPQDVVLYVGICGRPS